MNSPKKQQVLGVGISSTSYEEVCRLCRDWVDRAQAARAEAASEPAKYVCVTSVHGIMTARSVTSLEGSQRIHITGGPGSGKTRLARRLAQSRHVTVHDLDGLLLAAGDRLDKLQAEGTASSLAASAAWISDGVYVGWAEPFLERADVVLWLDVPWRS